MIRQVGLSGKRTDRGVLAIQNQDAKKAKSHYLLRNRSLLYTSFAPRLFFSNPRFKSTFLFLLAARYLIRRPLYSVEQKCPARCECWISLMSDWPLESLKFSGYNACYFRRIKIYAFVSIMMGILTRLCVVIANPLVKSALFVVDYVRI